MPLPALGALTSLTGGGAFTPSSSAASRATGETGAINVGGLNVGGTPQQNQVFIVAAAVVAIAIVFFMMRR